MSLRFFADHCVSNSMIERLCDAGYEVSRLKEHIPADSDDPPVLRKSREMQNPPKIIPALMRRLLTYSGAHPNMDDYKGQLLIVEAHRIRIRK